METSLTVRNMRRQSWALMLQEQSASGLSVREWCRLNRISTKSFYYRRKQVQTMILESAEEPRFAELFMPESVSAQTVPKTFNPVSIFVPQLTISAGNLTLSITQDTPRQLIADVLEVIRNA